VVKGGTGVYTLTHSLNTQNLSFTATATAGIGFVASIASQTNNSIVINTAQVINGALDSGFQFTITMDV